MPIEELLKPQELLARLKANLQGNAREELLVQICKKPATAYKAIELKLSQSDEEKLRLAEAAFVGVRKVANGRYASRAGDLLRACGHLSPDFRGRAVACIARVPHCAWDAVWDKFHIPDDAPATTEERKILLKGVAKSPLQAHIVLYNVIVTDTYKDANLSEDEKRILAPSAIRHILANPGNNSSEKLLAAMRKENLLTAEAKAKLNKAAA